MENVNSILLTTLISTALIATPLLLTSIGGLFSEKSGVINIGLEGMMIFGGFAGAMVMPMLVKSMDWYLVSLIGIIVGMLGAMLLGLLHAVLSIKFKVNQIISGTAINMLAPAVAFFTIKMVYGSYETPRINMNSGSISLGAGSNLSYNQLFVVALAILVFLASVFIFNKTKFGRHIIAVGQNPKASATAGINVNKLRFISVLISSAFAGFGGVSMVLLIESKLSATLITGYGFLAMAILIFAGWKPVKCMVGAILFGLFNAIQPALSRLVGSNNPEIAGVIELFTQIGPYIIAIILLVLFSKNARSPKALGTNYDKEER